MKRWEVNELRKEIPLAQIAATLAEPNRDKQKHPNPFTIEEFILVNRKPKKEASSEDQSRAMLAQVEYLNALFGGEDKRGKGATA